MEDSRLIYKKFEDKLFNSLKGHFYGQETIGSLMSLIFLKYINETSGKISDKNYIIPEVSNWRLISIENTNIVEKLNIAFKEFESVNDLKNRPFVYNFDKYLNNINSLKELIDILSYTNVVQIGLKLIDILDSVLLRFSGSYGQRYSMSIPPEEITKLLASFLPENNQIKVYNPFAGLASVTSKLPKGISFYSQESMIDTWQLGNLRLLADESENHIEYHCENSVKNWLPSKMNIKFDFIIGMPGFSIRLNKNETDAYGGDQMFYESYLIDKTIDSLNKNGKAAICTSRNILFASGREKSLRMKLIEHNILESLIILPEGLLANTSIPLAVFVLNKNKKLKSKVRYIDASNNVVIKGRERKLDIDSLIRIINKNESYKNVQYVSHEEIIENDYHLDMHRYQIPNIQLEEDAEFRTLEQLITIYERERVNQNTTGKFIRVRDLSDDPINSVYEFNEVELGQIPNHGAKLHKNSLLFSLRWKTLKPTYFTGDDNDVYYSVSDILACKIKTDFVDREYLIHELYEQYVLDQIEAYRMGSTVPYISAKNLLKIKIKLPALQNKSDYKASLKEQKAKVKGIKQALLASKAKELGLEDQILMIKKDQQEDLRSKKHNIAQHLNNIKSSLDSLTTFMNIKGGSLSSEEIINPNQGITVNERFRKMSKSIDDVIYLVDNITNDIDFGETEIIQLPEFLLEFVKKELPENNFEIDFEIDEATYIYSPSPYMYSVVKFSRLGFIEIFNNLIENAVKHGFTDKNRKYILKIELRHDFDNFTEIITISNNGNPFPKGMAERFCIKGEKGGKYANMGIGTWKICEIVKHFGGKVLAYDNEEDEFPVRIEIILPSAGDMPDSDPDDIYLNDSDPVFVM